MLRGVRSPIRATDPNPGLQDAASQQAQQDALRRLLARPTLRTLLPTTPSAVGPETGVAQETAPGINPPVASPTSGDTDTGADQDEVPRRSVRPVVRGPISPSQDYSDLLSGYLPRGQLGEAGHTGGAGTLGGGLQGASAGASVGAAFGPATMGLSVPIGAGIGALVGWLSRHSDTAQTDYRVEDASAIIQQAYRKYLGQNAPPDEVAQHLQNIGWRPGSRWVGTQGLMAILDSIAARPKLAPAPTAPSGTAASVPASPGAGSSAPLDLSAFDAGRLANANDTAPKYYFARWMRDRGLAPTTENLRQFVMENPDWEMQGTDLLRVKPEKLGDPRWGKPGQQSVWQDVIRDVGGPGAQWQFQNAAGTGEGFAPAQTGTAPGQAWPVSQGQNPEELLSPDPMAAIRAELAALLAGEPSPLLRNRILQKLQDQGRT